MRPQICQRNNMRKIFLLLFFVLSFFCGCESSLDDAKATITKEAQNILAQDQCTASWENVQVAFQLAGEAQKAGLDDTANRLIDWAKSALTNYAVCSGNQAPEEERLEIAAEAQKLGMDQLADDLLNNKLITSSCFNQWEGSMDFSTAITGSDQPIHLDFAFCEKDNKITGQAQGTHHDRFAGTQGCAGPIDVCCIEFVNNPASAEISGNKGTENFNVEFDVKYDYTQAACGLSLPNSTTGLLPLTFSAQEQSNYDCSVSSTICTLSLEKIK